MSMKHLLTRGLIPAGLMIAYLSLGDNLHAAQTPVAAPQSLFFNLPGSGAIWLFLAAMVVMFMHLGFAMIATGFCRAKNALNTVAMNLMIFPLCGLAFWVYGFAVGWGNSSRGAVPPGWAANLEISDNVLNRGLGVVSVLDDAGKSTGGYAYGLIGGQGFFLSGMDTGSAQAGVLALFLFMLAVFCKAAMIPVGAMAERWRWNNFCFYGAGVVFPFAVCANWVWGGGWLAGIGRTWRLGHGVIDFSGAGVIQLLCGLIALVGAWLLGPRIGKYRNGRPQPLPAHHVPMIVLGSLIVAFGWLAWNAGFALSGIDLSVSEVAVNTTLAGCAGTLGAMLTLKAKKMKPDPTLICNGLVAGLVAVSGPCPFIDSWAAVLVGAVAGSAVVSGVLLLERRGIDDPVGAISVHGIAGLWGLLAVGIFANGKHGGRFNGVAGGVRGLLYGDAGQLAAQAIGALVIVVFGTVFAWGALQIGNRLSPMRVLRDVELEGLDGPELGALAYPDFALTRHA
jgi:ammonium transporter, Amt family